jgi:putative redox protein
MTKVTVSVGKGMRTTLAARHHAWIADEPTHDGGTDTGPTPMELLLSAVGACAAITAKMYAERKGWPLEGVDIDLSLERFKKADYAAYTGESDVVNEFCQSIVFRGPLTDEQKRRLLEIAGKCPVHRVLTQPNFMFEELAAEATSLD